MSLVNYYNNSVVGCFNFLGDGIEVNVYMFCEMKVFSFCLLFLYCVVNMFLGFLLCVGNVFVILMVVFFFEFCIVINIGLVCLLIFIFFNGLILYFFLCVIGFNVLVNGCLFF